MQNQKSQNNQLAVLDVWVDANNNKIALKTYQRSINTGLYIKWPSFVL